ncbi:hypothetical protein BD770DRAFT_443568 [Pilaira anomala]|nr:hypothetical protein BD770DRAFT_443568 [Pilaira anomala]
MPIVKRSERRMRLKKNTNKKRNKKKLRADLNTVPALFKAVRFKAISDLRPQFPEYFAYFNFFQGINKAMTRFKAAKSRYCTSGEVPIQEEDFDETDDSSSSSSSGEVPIKEEGFDETLDDSSTPGEVPIKQEDFDETLDDFSTPGEVLIKQEGCYQTLDEFNTPGEVLVKEEDCYQTLEDFNTSREVFIKQEDCYQTFEDFNTVGIRFEGFYKNKIKGDKLNDNEQRGFILYSKLTESSIFLNYATIYHQRKKEQQKNQRKTTK